MGTYYITHSQFIVIVVRSLMILIALINKHEWNIEMNWAHEILQCSIKQFRQNIKHKDEKKRNNQKIGNQRAYLVPENGWKA